MLDLNVEAITNIGLEHYIALSAMLFCIGMLGVLTRKNILVILMSIEIMLNAVNLSFIAFSYYSGRPEGQVMVFFVMTIAAAEAGVGLALMVAIYKRFKTVDLNSFERLKG